MLAICLCDPSSARARPSSLLKADLDYERIFDRERSHEIYLWAAKTQKAVDSFLRGQEDVTQSELTNLKFHLSTLLVSEALGRSVEPTKPNDIDGLVGREFSESDIRSALDRLRVSMKSYLEESGLAMDRAAKTSDFVKSLLAQYFPDPALKPA